MQVETPEGLVNFPDSMSEDEVLSVLRQKFPKQQTPAPMQSEQQNAFGMDVSTGDRVTNAIGFNESPNNPVLGLADTVYRAGSGIATGLGAPLVGMGILGAQKLGLAEGEPSDVVDYVHALERNYAPSGRSPSALVRTVADLLGSRANPAVVVGNVANYAAEQIPDETVKATAQLSVNPALYVGGAQITKPVSQVVGKTYETVMESASNVANRLNKPEVAKAVVENTQKQLTDITNKAEEVYKQEAPAVAKQIIDNANSRAQKQIKKYEETAKVEGDLVAKAQDDVLGIANNEVNTVKGNALSQVEGATSLYDAAYKAQEAKLLSEKEAASSKFREAESLVEIRPETALNAADFLRLELEKLNAKGAKGLNEAELAPIRARLEDQLKKIEGDKIAIDPRYPEAVQAKLREEYAKQQSNDNPITIPVLSEAISQAKANRRSDGSIIPDKEAALFSKYAEALQKDLDVAYEKQPNQQAKLLHEQGKNQWRKVMEMEKDPLLNRDNTQSFIKGLNENAYKNIEANLATESKQAIFAQRLENNIGGSLANADVTQLKKSLQKIKSDDVMKAINHTEQQRIVDGIETKIKSFDEVSESAKKNIDMSAKAKDIASKEAETLQAKTAEEITKEIGSKKAFDYTQDKFSKATSPESFISIADEIIKDAKAGKIDGLSVKSQADLIEFAFKIKKGANEFRRAQIDYDKINSLPISKTEKAAKVIEKHPWWTVSAVGTAIGGTATGFGVPLLTLAGGLAGLKILHIAASKATKSKVNPEKEISKINKEAQAESSQTTNQLGGTKTLSEIMRGK